MKLTKVVKTFILGLTLGVTSASGASLDLTDEPLFLQTGASANVLFNMSVETPMGGGAYNDAPGSITDCTGRKSVGGVGSNLGTCYFPTYEYLGYFDPLKCYTYGSSRFTPSSDANTTTHACSGEWSGNFLNWASMTAIDTFINTMTGGRRTTDTTSQTVVERSLAFVASYGFHTKAIGTSIDNSTGSGVDLSTVTPFSNNWAKIVQNQNSTTFTLTLSSGSSSTYNVAVEVCKQDSNLTNNGLEDNCIAYTDGSTTYYKPEGLIQENAKRMKFGVMAYTTDNSKSRHGGVLRSNMKYVGPEEGTGAANSLKEYGDDGIYIANPESASSGNSGVMNYINKFAVLAGNYKSYDPVSELFYEAIRFYRGLTPTPEYYSGLTTSDNGGFPIITSWENPIQYECQQNFMIAMNDAFPWLDKRVPGTHFDSASKTDARGNTVNSSNDDYGNPSNAASFTDATSGSQINVKDLTNEVGSLEDTETGGEITAKLGTDKLGEIIAAQNGGSLVSTGGRENTYYIAGLAYYANTNDLNSSLTGDQTVTTFMIDSQEYNSNPLTGNVNQLWLTGKYGGFTDEDGDGEPDTDEWDADGDGEPDNYVLATEPTKMIDKLQDSFNAISTVTTASATSVAINSTVLRTTSRLFQAKFNSSDWSGELSAFELDPTDATPITPSEWDASDHFPAHGSRNIVTMVDNAGTLTAADFDSTNVTLPTSDSSSSIVTQLVSGGTASQSSTCFSGNASKAIDGNTDGNYFSGSVTHSCNHTGNEYWQVDLGSEKTIDHLEIYNRTDGTLEERLSNAVVMVSDTPFSSATNNGIIDSADAADFAAALANADAGGQITGSPIRINMGDNTLDYTDSRGRIWLTEDYFASNTSATSTSNTISGVNSGFHLSSTTDETVYQTARRRNNNDVALNIPVSSGKQYEIIMHFADPDSTAAGQRVFNIDIEGTTVQAGYDIFDTTGAKDTATTLSFSVTTGDTNLDIDLDRVSGDPIISAIEVIPPMEAGSYSLSLGISGRYIRIQKAGTINGNDFNITDFLSLAEVETYEQSTVGSSLTSAELVDYIRGDQSKELSQTNGTLRTRSSILGDIVNSSPISVGATDLFYQDLPGTEGSTYDTFVSSKSSVYTDSGTDFTYVYAGANDGMLHAFDSRTGAEVFAYVPSTVHDELYKLSDPNYAHQYYVDGTPVASDAFIDIDGTPAASDWRTMLASSLGAGGRTVFALDITTPASFSTNDVMWEFSHDTDTANGSDEMGYVLHQPQIVRMEDGNWAVIFGNGFNSNSQQARLVILNAKDGSILQIINTETGNSSTPNGLSKPFLLDSDLDGSVDAAYAGDLLGNMWKFDLSGSAGSWDVEYKTSGNPAPLYTALDPDGVAQPITSAPTVVVHPEGGYNVLFGTGKFFETGDNIIPTTPQVQTFYGVRDNGSKLGSGRLTGLIEQEITLETTVTVDQGTADSSDDTTNTVRVVSQNSDSSKTDGFYLDLVTPTGTDSNGNIVSTKKGERVVSNPLNRFGRVIFTTFTPDSNPCESGGSSFIMELDAVTGARLENAVFDTNGDGIIDDDDLVDTDGDGVGDTATSGTQIEGTLGDPSIIQTEDETEFKLTSGTTGTVTSTAESKPVTVGRQSWRQIK